MRAVEEQPTLDGEECCGSKVGVHIVLGVLISLPSEGVLQHGPVEGVFHVLDGFLPERRQERMSDQVLELQAKERRLTKGG
jgi:hypothetical protein